MRELKNFELEYNEKVSCNNGEHHTWKAKGMSGTTCRCFNGCHGTDKIVKHENVWYLEKGE